MGERRRWGEAGRSVGGYNVNCISTNQARVTQRLACEIADLKVAGSNPASSLPSFFLTFSGPGPGSGFRTRAPMQPAVPAKPGAPPFFFLSPSLLLLLSRGPRPVACWLASCRGRGGGQAIRRVSICKHQAGRREAPMALDALVPHPGLPSVRHGARCNLSCSLASVGPRVQRPVQTPCIGCIGSPCPDSSSTEYRFPTARPPPVPAGYCPRCLPPTHTKHVLSVLPTLC